MFEEVSHQFDRYGEPESLAEGEFHVRDTDHLAPHVKVDSPLMPPGHGFGLGFAVRTQGGIAPFMGSVGQFFWSGMGGTFFWIDPVEDLFAVFMSQGPGQRTYTRTLARNLVYAALE